MTLSCITSEIKQDIGRKPRFFMPLAFDVPVRGVTHRSIAIPFGMEKLEWSGYPIVKKTMTTCLAISTEYRRVTDGRTDILLWHRPCYAKL